MVDKNQIKIACIGNMNNMMFSLMRYLNDAGYEAHLFLFSNEMHHFSPESDTWNIDKWKDKIIQLPFGDNLSYFLTSKSKIRSFFRGYDWFVGTGICPAFFHKAGLKLNIFAPFGADIYQFPFYMKGIRKALNERSLIGLLKGLFYIPISTKQNRGIKSAGKVFIQTSGIKFYEEAVHNLKLTNHYEITIPMVYAEVVREEQVSSFLLEIRSELKKSQFVVFNHSRQYWKKTDGIDSKDALKQNDLMIKAFSDFCLNNPLINGKLVLFNYGKDVDESKNLIESLGIQSRVMWLDMMKRKEILLLLDVADVGSDQFNSLWGGTGREVLSKGVLLLNKRIDEKEYKTKNGHSLPLYLPADSKEEILNQLEWAYENRLKQESTKAEILNWFNENLGVGLAMKYLPISSK